MAHAAAMIPAPRPSRPHPRPALPPSPVGEAQRARYRAEGYAILPGVIPPHLLQLLRDGCQAAIDATDRELDRLGTDVSGINHRGKRYFAGHPSLQQPRLWEFIRSPLMLSIVADLVGPEAYVFWEQYVVKAADSNMRFAWHQDSGYVGDETQHDPYLTCWCALDDMTLENGTISVLPFSRAGGCVRHPHHQEEGTNDLVGYTGDDPGELVLVPAGSIALFTSHTLHRSGANVTGKPRRSYLIQYSNEVIRRPDFTPWGRTERVL